MLQMQEQKPGKAAEATTPGPQNQNANILEPGFSTHLQPQCRHRREWGAGPPRHGVGTDMAHWGPAAGPHGHRGLRGERMGQGAGGRQGPGAWDTGGLLVRKTARGKIPHVHRALPPRAASRHVALPFPPVSADPRTPALSSRQSPPPFMSKSSRVSTFQCPSSMKAPRTRCS